MKKLDIRSVGLYSVLDKIGLYANQLDLLAASRVHSMFHVALLEPFKPTLYPGQISVPAGPTSTYNEGEPVYEVANILNS